MAAAVSILIIRGSPRRRVAASRAPAPAPLNARLPLLESASELHAPEVVQDGLVVLPLLDSDSALYPPLLLREDSLALPLLGSGSTLYPPTLEQTVTLPLLASDSILYGMQVATGQQIAMPLLGSASILHAPALAQSMQFARLESSSALYPPVVIREDILYLPLLGSSSALYGPSLNRNVRLPFLASSSLLRPPTIALSPIPGGALSAPVVTLTSSAGEVPEATITMGADIYAGFYLRIQRSTTGTRNATDGTYAVPTLNITHQVTPSEIAALAVTNADLAADGYVDPTGTWFQQYRWEREDGALSAWSNEISGTVSGSVASWPTVSNANKSQYIDVSGLTGTMNANINSLRLVRSTVAAVNTKFHYELTVAGIYSGTQNANGTVGIGLTDAATNLNAASGYPFPGQTAPGLSVYVRKGSTGVTVRANGVQVSGTALDAAPAVGDVIALEYDRTNNAYLVKYKRLATGTTKTIASGSLTTQIPSTVYACAGGFRVGDSFTANFGASAFAIAASTGYSFYG